MEILYFEGDPCSPKYVQGALEKLGLRVQRADEGWSGEPSADLYLLSDQPADKLGDAAMRRLVDAVENGAGLVVVGGWKSFGRGGYAGTPLADILPTEVFEGDDRVTLPSGAFLAPASPHAITDGLPFDSPPVVTGFNRFQAKRDARVVLLARPVAGVSERGASLTGDPEPVLLVGEAGQGRVAAIATDLAPHWSGGLTDWGSRLVDVGHDEEVGTAYLRLLGQLTSWTARMALPRAAKDVLTRA